MSFPNNSFIRFLGLGLLFMITSLISINAQSSYQIPKEVKRILFIGNSITWNGKYVNYIDTYFSLYHPDRSFEIINVGLPSETLSGLSEEGHAQGRFPRPALQERLERVLKTTKPDLVFACYGMNDGIYLPFDEERFKAYKEGIKWLHASIEKTGTNLILMTPPAYDQQKGAAYANVLDIYSHWLLSFQYTENWKVIDIHEPMKKYLENQRKNNPDFALAPDGIHPNALGHWLMAKAILLYLGAPEVNQESSFEDLLAPFKKGQFLFEQIEKRQAILRDAYLSTTGHKRPGLPEGLSLEDAYKKIRLINQKIQVD